MDGTPAIRLQGLTKTYGRVRGIESLDLEVAQGEVFGFLGPNGAGKSTTIRLLLDLIRPTRGQAWVLGMDCQRQGLAIRRRVGYLPGELSLYEASTGRQLLDFCAGVRGGVDPLWAVELERRLEVDLSRRICDLSKGNKQKIGILLAMVHRPDVLILDEPTTGLDPLVQQEVHNLLVQAREEGRTVFLSSHVLSEVERVADRVGIIREGGLAAVEAIADLKQRARRRLTITFARPVAPEAFAGVPGVRSAEAVGRSVHLAVEGPMLAALKVATRFEVESVESHDTELEEIFLSYYTAGGQAHAA